MRRKLRGTSIIASVWCGLVAFIPKFALAIALFWFVSMWLQRIILNMAPVDEWHREGVGQRRFADAGAVARPEAQPCGWMHAGGLTGANNPRYSPGEDEHQGKGNAGVDP